MFVLYNTKLLSFAEQLFQTEWNNSFKSGQLIQQIICYDGMLFGVDIPIQTDRI